MADPVIVAVRRADAQRKFDVESVRLAKRLDIAAPADIPSEINQDQELRKVHELERVVDFIAAVNTAMDKPSVAKAVQNAVAGVVPVVKPKDAPPAPATPKVLATPPTK